MILARRSVGWKVFKKNFKASRQTPAPIAAKDLKRLHFRTCAQPGAKFVLLLSGRPYSYPYPYLLPRISYPYLLPVSPTPISW
ncbi:hypothetical protein Q31b_54230 [Novipirellula aureliae]|uniref:Uncharacterized protein n=1 Tax=Novipirellula aureliae TaxID=2527966 RepID=A0A5C6DHL2_9BACT|nr:hypothetical protein Q31b_54230 [Novipirellula aureliae]